MCDPDRHDITIETERLILRRPEASDLEAMTPLAQNYAVTKNTGSMPYPYNFDDAKQFLSRVNENWGRDLYVFAICLKSENGNIIGAGGPFKFQTGQVELGYWIGEPYWGNGYMTEAVRAFCELVFNRLKAPFLEASHMVDNPASGRVLEKCGFRGSEIRAIYSFSRGEFTPARYLRIDAEYWRAQRKQDAS